MRCRSFIIALALILMPLMLCGQTATVSGTITDARSGETLIGATVVDMRSGKGAVSNMAGHYSLTLPRDSVTLRVSFVGYEPQEVRLLMDRSREVHVSLVPSLLLQEVTITAERPGDLRSSQMSAVQVTMEKIRSVPVLFGEADLIKALQLLPGVQSGSEGGSGMYVRGGGPDENLFLLDGVPLYNVTHLGGFFSAFNTDAVKNVTLYKGSFPARFGGRLSAVLDVTQNNGNDKELHGNLSVGLISAKCNLEGPIVRERTTFSFSFRRTYAELFIIPLALSLNKNSLAGTSTSDGGADAADYDAGYYFYDFNARVTHKFSDRSRLHASFYMGDDKLHGAIHTINADDEDVDLGFSSLWGNIVASLRWNYAMSPKLFLNVTGSFSRYRNVIVGSVVKQPTAGDHNASTIEGDYTSGIREGSLRADFDYTPSPEHSVRFGGGVTRHWFSPEVATASIDYFDSLLMNDTLHHTLDIGSSMVMANTFTLFGEDDWSVSDALKVNYGLHLSCFRLSDTVYPSLQPRLSARLLLTPDLSVKVGYAAMTQYVHLLSTTSVTLPTDLWMPVTRRVLPMRSHQVAGGVSYSLSGIADFSAEVYYKHMDNLLEYRDGATLLGSYDAWENLVCMGRGWSYGVEILVQREVGRLTGWVGYTWSRTMRLFDRKGQELNNGEPFPAKYDRRHDLSVVLNYKQSERVDFNVTWVYSSGNAASLATQSYPIAQEESDDYDHMGRRGAVNYIEGRNNYRMPDYHRLDVGVNFHKKFKRARRCINVSIYNVYNRQNPYMLYRSSRDTYAHYPSALVQLSLFPILPSVAYTLYF